MKISSDFAILDVKKGRHKLFTNVEAGKTYHVVVVGILNEVHGPDDSVSREFQIDVNNVTIWETP